MKPDTEERLAALIDRELKQLPEQEAPATLVPRVLAALRQRAALPWYRTAWQTWPYALQVASLAVLGAMFGGLCFGGWELSHGATANEVTQVLQQWFSGFSVAGNVLSVIAHAGLLAAQHLGPVFLAGCAFAALAAYLSCLGLGTAFVRLAVARR